MGLCRYFCYFGLDFLLPDMMSKQERPAFLFGDLGLSEQLARGAPRRPSPPLRGFPKVQLGREDEWEVPIIAPEAGRKSMVGRVRGCRSAPKMGSVPASSALRPPRGEARSPRGAHERAQGTARGWGRPGAPRRSPGTGARSLRWSQLRAVGPGVHEASGLEPSSWVSGKVKVLPHDTRTMKL